MYVIFLESARMLNKFTFNEYSLEYIVACLDIIPKINSSQSFKP